MSERTSPAFTDQSCPLGTNSRVLSSMTATRSPWISSELTRSTTSSTGINGTFKRSLSSALSPISSAFSRRRSCSSAVCTASLNRSWTHRKEKAPISATAAPIQKAQKSGAFGLEGVAKKIASGEAEVATNSPRRLATRPRPVLTPVATDHCFKRCRDECGSGAQYDRNAYDSSMAKSTLAGRSLGRFLKISTSATSSSRALAFRPATIFATTPVPAMETRTVATDGRYLSQSTTGDRTEGSGAAERNPRNERNPIFRPREVLCPIDC